MAKFALSLALHTGQAPRPCGARVTSGSRAGLVGRQVGEGNNAVRRGAPSRKLARFHLHKRVAAGGYDCAGDLVYCGHTTTGFGYRARVELSMSS
jgi:hypothetical protein